MSTQKTGNPFLPENFLSAGGLWDGKVVTITASKVEAKKLNRGDGTAVLNRDGEQSILVALNIVGIDEGGEAERREDYSAGWNISPSNDGEYFVDPKTGLPTSWKRNTNMAKFAEALIASGFDVNSLYDGEHMRASALVGAIFLMKADAELDKNGKVKLDKNGYEKQKFFPVEFKGYKPGVGGTTQPQPGSSPLTDKAAETVLGILAEEGGKVSRADLVRKVSAKLAGDSDCNKVIAMIAKDSFHNGQPWVREGTGYTLQ